MRTSNKIFELGIEFCLAPINFFLRSLGYPLGVVVSVCSIFVWAMPVIILFSALSNLIFLLEIIIKLIKK